MTQIYLQFVDLPFPLLRLALYLPLSAAAVYLIFRIVRDLRGRADLFDLDTHHWYSAMASLGCTLLCGDVAALTVLEFLAETLLVVTAYAVLDSLCAVLVYHKSPPRRRKYR